MQTNKLISEKFRNLEGSLNLVELYSENIFSQYYSDIQTENFLNDLEYYKSRLTKSENIIELASGSGRILIPLAEDGYNIVGIEKEKEMIMKMEKHQDKVIHENIFCVEKLKKEYSRTDCLLLPATSISLFSLENFAELLNSIKIMNKGLRIILDVYNLRKFLSEKPKKEITEKGTFYYLNFEEDNCIIYNIFHKESQKIGYSVKFNHNWKDIVSMLQKIGFYVKITNPQKDYFIIEGVMHE
ncbi:hypothetical protein G4D61_17490 [Bacillus ginsengihumi]|uniref:Methyltransferase domain-containing protein n=1 Tax=Heyndrickxia ginsengihumi TaxID=363870 RepID=A0A6M0PC88_9BACI|nr:class I SAM-dependent methyltransferase [Heyndrickxia ginsengihumi]NEY21710.1 hypothetical protein [Heyndrickxia ginsengihumi]